jgi:hypothetical protein
MLTVKFGKTKYIQADKILELAPIYSKGNKNTRSLIRSKNITDDMYLFAKKNEDGKWKRSDGKSAKFDKVFIKKEFLKNIPELNRDENEVIVDENGVQEAPEVIDLEDEEKFRDDEGNIVEIETRGERSYDGVYFRVKDVSVGFQIENLKKVIQKINSSYIDGVDYKFFTLLSGTNNSNKKSKNIIRNEMFLTYEGILKVLFVSRKGKTNGFVKWATEKLFTLQMGTRDQKEDLVSGVLGIPAKSLRQVLSTSSTNVPCIYRFALGKCNDLRKIMKISEDVPDDYIIIKYGYTDNLIRRTNEHIKTYNKIKGVKLELMNYAYIDPKYLSQAETDIKGFFETIETPIEYEKFSELVAINPKHEKQIINQFKYITGEYAGCVKELIEKIKKLENDIVIMKKDHLNELQKEQHKNDLLMKDNLILTKDLEIEKLKNQHYKKK